jgi:hypothetical protein
MLKHDPNYRRLKLGGRGFLGSSSYWLARDHLLVVEVANYTERYRRFYFRDLQAVIIQQSNYRFLVNVIVGLLAILILVGFLLAMSSGGMNATALMILAVIELTPLTLLLINQLRGPTCSVHLRTAVQTQKLANLTRWAKADQLVAELTPLVQSAQTAPATEAVSGSAAPGTAAPGDRPPVA